MECISVTYKQLFTICAFDSYFLSAYYVLGSVLGHRD